SFDVFLRVVGHLAAQIGRRARRVLAAVLFASRALVAEDFAAADHVDLLDLVFSCSLVVAHERGKSKEDTGPRRAPMSGRSSSRPAMTAATAARGPASATSTAVAANLSRSLLNKWLV